MTTAAAAIGLTYKAIDIQAPDFSIFLEITQGLDDSPDVRGVDVTVPAADEQTARPRRFHQRKILLAGHVMGNGSDQATARANYRLSRQVLSALFDATAAPGDLVATLEDGSTATIPCRTLPGGLAAIEVIPSEYARLSIELLAIEDWTIEVLGS
jgi:hypothetical protein